MTGRDQRDEPEREEAPEAPAPRRTGSRRVTTPPPPGSDPHPEPEPRRSTETANDERLRRDVPPHY